MPPRNRCCWSAYPEPLCSAKACWRTCCPSYSRPGYARYLRPAPRRLCGPGRPNHPDDETGRRNRDDMEAFDFRALEELLRFAKREGRLPADFCIAHDIGSETSRAFAEVSVRERGLILGQLEQKIDFGSIRAIGIDEGPLLFLDPTARDLLDVKLFIRAGRQLLKGRALGLENLSDDSIDDAMVAAQERSGECFDHIRWPSCVWYHRNLFFAEDVEGLPKLDYCNSLGIRMQPIIDFGMVEALRWAIDVLCNDIREIQTANRGNEIRDEIETHRRSTSWQEKLRKFVEKMY